MTNSWDWINEEFDRANARTASLPPWARPIITRPVTSRSAVDWKSGPSADPIGDIRKAVEQVEQATPPGTSASGAVVTAKATGHAAPC